MRLKLTPFAPRRIRLISVIIVNYNSSDLLIDCLDSLKRQVVVDKGKAVPLEIIVVDNNSSPPEKEKLSQIDHGMVNVVKQDTNIGFAGANNLGFSLAQGDCVLFVNPDTYFFDGALDKLYHLLNTRNAGAVGPKTLWDKEKTFLLPRSELPTIYSNLIGLGGTRFLSLGRFLNNRWLKKSLDYWCADKPLKVNMLSGGCILTRKDVIDEVGLFDEIYPMYYEDADWCLRVLRNGYALYYCPRAEIVHYYNQSAKDAPDESIQNMINSAEIYFSKNFGFISNWFRKSITAYLSSKSKISMDDYGEIDIYKESFTASSVDGSKTSGKYLLEVSRSEFFIPSAGAFLNEPEYKMHYAILERLEPGYYFTRLTSLADMKVIKKWRWVVEPNLE